MCVICVKPTGVQLPSEAVLRQCFNHNSDGAGYMFKDGDKVHIKKGFMTFKDFYDSVTKDYEEKDGLRKAFVLHFRIGTSGSNTAGLTHPYPVSKSLDDLKQTDCLTDIGMAHNGIISLTSKSEDKKVDRNDTMAFIMDYVALFVKNDKDLDDPDKVRVIQQLVGSWNKLVFLTKNTVRMVGNFEKDEATQCLFSNMYWKHSYSYTTYSTPSKPKAEQKKVDEETEKEIEEALPLDIYYGECYNKESGKYDFEDQDCPWAYEDRTEFCDPLICSNYYKCKRCIELARKRRKALKSLRKKAKKYKNKSMVELIDKELKGAK